MVDRRGYDTQKRGVAQRRGVWYTVEGCSTQERGVVHSRRVWLTGDGYDTKKVVWHREEGCGTR